MISGGCGFVTCIVLLVGYAGAMECYKHQRLAVVLLIEVYMFQFDDLYEYCAGCRLQVEGSGAYVWSGGLPQMQGL
jgi:hypothetical protein